MLYLALSCFQSRPQDIALADLMALNPDGIQLTPGNIPTDNFQASLTIPYTFHHGFSWSQKRREVYTNDLKEIDIQFNQSIHPPKRFGEFDHWFKNSGDYIFEVMYPEYFLGLDQEILTAMEAKKRLAIDISHLNILIVQKVITNSTLRKLLNYDKIEEIHVSHNQGRADSHQPIHANSPFLAWVRERKETVVVYESYMHRLSFEERKQQVSIVREILS